MFEKYLNDPSVNSTLKTGMYVVNEVSKWVSSFWQPKPYMDFYFSKGVGDVDEGSVTPLGELKKSKDELHSAILNFEGAAPEELLVGSEKITAARDSADEAMKQFIATSVERGNNFESEMEEAIKWDAEENEDVDPEEDEVTSDEEDFEEETTPQRYDPIAEALKEGTFSIHHSQNCVLDHVKALGEPSIIKEACAVSDG